MCIFLNLILVNLLLNFECTAIFYQNVIYFSDMKCESRLLAIFVSSFYQQSITVNPFHCSYYFKISTEHVL